MWNTRRLACLLAALVVALPAFAGDFEEPPVFKASELLPAELRKSAVHEVRETVPTKDYFQQFEMESKFGFFDVDSMALLKIRVHECVTLAQVFEREATNDYFKGLGARLAQAVTAPVKLITDPVGTVESIGRGIGKRLKGIGRLFRKRDKSKQEDRGLRAALVSAEKRRLAFSLSLDVYSTNPKVQEFLNDVATARVSGKLTFDLATFAVPGVGGTVIGAATFTGEVDDLLRDKSPGELHEYNGKILAEMGIPEGLARQFLEHRHLSPRHKTVITDALHRMAKVEGRAILLEAAVDTDSESTALFHERRARVLADVHEGEKPLVRFDSLNGLPIATARSGMRGMVFPLDVLYWSEDIAAIVGGVAEDGGKLTIYLSGTATERAKKGLVTAGLDLREGVDPIETAPTPKGRD